MAETSRAVRGCKWLWKSAVLAGFILWLTGCAWGIGGNGEPEWQPVNKEMQALLQSPAPEPSAGSSARKAAAESPSPAKIPAVSGSLTASAARAETGTASAPPEESQADVGERTASDAAASLPPQPPKEAVAQPASQSSGRININAASAGRLEELPGIGPGKAKAIVQYRETHGLFTKPEDLMNVKGIGQKTYDALKDRIYVP